MLSSFTLQMPMKVASRATVTATQLLRRRARASRALAVDSSMPGSSSGSISMVRDGGREGVAALSRLPRERRRAAPAKGVGANAHAGREERMRRCRAMCAGAGGKVQLHVVSDDVRHARVEHQRPGAPGLLARLVAG